VDFDGFNNDLTVAQIFSNGSAFAALRSDGSVVTWGIPNHGGDSRGVDFDGPNNNLSVSQIFSTNSAFAALRSDGSVVTWGYSYYGGDSVGVNRDKPNANLRVMALANPFTDDRLILPDLVVTMVGVNKLTLTESPIGGIFNASASLSQEGNDRPLLAIGVDASSLAMGDTQTFIDNTVSIAASVTSSGPAATAFGMSGSSLQLRPGDDTITIEASISGTGPGSTIAVRDSLVGGNRGDDTITLRGDLWGDRALVFGGAGNDTITGYGIGRDSFIQAGDGDDVVSLGRLETTPGAAPLERAKGAPVQPSTYRGGNGFDVLHLRDTTQAEFEAQATPFTTANESGWLFQGARFSGFEQFLFG
jgi:hypothetical protein